MSKTNKKILTVAICAAFVVCAVIGGTIAYLQDTESVENTFTVGRIGITLDEAKVNTDGEPTDEENNPVSLADAPRVYGNEYKLIPGHSYTKDPTVHVDADSEECYVRMLVTVNNQEVLDGIFAGSGSAGDLTSIFTGYDPSKWELVNAHPHIEHDERVYEFRYYTKLPASAEVQNLEPLFDGFTLPKFITGDHLGQLKDFRIKVEAHAIQADGFADAAEAWDAFTGTV